ncbi:MAG: FAD-binding oxidoreductase [Chloroflexota bacterium]
MRRWNGWGEESTDYPLPPSAKEYLEKQIGAGLSLEDASLIDTLSQVPESRLPGHALISNLPADRLLHARGQSLPDWVALRSGCIQHFPDGVAFPQDLSAVKTLLEFARQTHTILIPYGGGTSVVGHINPLPGEAPILTVDLSRMNHLVDLDETSHLATFEAGISGPEIGKHLQDRGFTLGHYPQSFEFSTLGGWIATRSSGQQSYHYGRIEHLFAGGHVQSFLGEMEMPVHPASAAGPDLKQFFLGSEGRFGILTRATVRIQRIPESESFHAAFFHDWETGSEAVREIAQAGIPVSMLRLSNALETATTLALSGKKDLVLWAERALDWVRYDDQRCLLIFGLTGSRSLTRYAYKQATHIIRSHAGLPTGTLIGRMWRKSRFLSPYLRNTLWEQGYALDTLETAMPWSGIPHCARDVLASLKDGLAEIGESVLAFAHLSHVYQDGASLYVTYLYRRAEDPQETLRRWQILKSTASQIIVQRQGTITHQHGIGRDHASYLASEKGVLGMQTLKALGNLLDPQGLLNPGKLLLEE